MRLKKITLYRYLHIQTLRELLVIYRHIQKRHPAREKPIYILLRRLQTHVALRTKLSLHAPRFAPQPLDVIYNRAEEAAY
jgi:hypothetical protein